MAYQCFITFYLDNMFGCDLSKVVEVESGTVPNLLIKCMEEVEKRGIYVK